MTEQTNVQINVTKNENSWVRVHVVNDQSSSMFVFCVAVSGEMLTEERITELLKKNNPQSFYCRWRKKNFSYRKLSTAKAAFSFLPEAVKPYVNIMEFKEVGVALRGCDLAVEQKQKKVDKEMEKARRRAQRMIASGTASPEMIDKDFLGML